MKTNNNLTSKFLILFLISYLLLQANCLAHAVHPIIGIDPRQSSDSDNDSLPDSLEGQIGTDPNNPDTDFDGLYDGWEYYRGLDPLIYTTSTGEAIEAIATSMIIAIAGTVISFVLVYRNKKNAKDNYDIKIVRRYSILTACLVLAFLLFFVRPPAMHGPIDPGENVSVINFYEPMNVNFSIIESQYYRPTLRVEASYEVPNGVVCYCTVQIIHQNGSVIDTQTLIILPTPENNFQSWDAYSWNLEYGNYTIHLSASFRDFEDNPVEVQRPMKVDLIQIWKDGRNEDQILWDEFKNWMNIGAAISIIFGVIFFLYYGEGINQAVRYRRYN